MADAAVPVWRRQLLAASPLLASRLAPRALGVGCLLITRTFASKLPVKQLIMVGAEQLEQGGAIQMRPVSVSPAHVTAEEVADVAGQAAELG